MPRLRPAALLLATAWSLRAAADVPDWDVPGDGKTPTFIQQLDAVQISTRPLGHLASTSVKGAAVYGYDLPLPPAILAPSIGLSYSSESGVNPETVTGWAMSGLLELRRPFAQAFGDDEWIVSGPGFNGVLECDTAEARYVLSTSGRLRVVAEWDTGSDTWTLKSDGVTYTLEAVDGGTGSTDGAALYRVTVAQDGNGNAIEYSYASADGRIQSIEYGGNLVTGEGHLVKIGFTYSGRHTVRSTARASFFSLYEKRIEEITVSTRRIPAAAYVRQNALVVSYDLQNEQDVVALLTREGLTSSTSEDIVAFTYNEYDATLPAAYVSTTVPAGLGRTSSVQEGANDESVGRTLDLLVDFNRDGLPDFLMTDDPAVVDPDAWMIDIQEVSYPFGTYSWTSGGVWTTTDGPGEETVTEGITADNQYEPWRRSVTTRRTLDVNGDGYLDHLISTDPDEWQVYYGDVFGGWSAPELEPAPDDQRTYSRTRYSVLANHPSALSYHLDVEQDLIDLNGDGWLDAYDPINGVAWLHSGIEGGGWTEEITTRVFPEGFRTVDYVLSTESFTVDAEDACVAACEDSCATGWGDAYDECVGECQDECDCETDTDCGYDCVDECDSSYDLSGCLDGCYEEKDTECAADGDWPCDCENDWECADPCEVECDIESECYQPCYDDQDTECFSNCESGEGSCEEMCYDSSDRKSGGPPGPGPATTPRAT